MDATKAALLRALTNQRAHILEVVDSLDEDALLRPVLPSDWTCAGLVNHLWLDVERWWFLIVASAQQPMALEDTQVVWKAEGVSPAEAIAGYRADIVAADAVIESMDLEAPPLFWPEDVFGTWRLPDLRAILLHVIVETACHAGHLDAARELINGQQYLVLE